MERLAAAFVRMREVIPKPAKRPGSPCSHERGCDVDQAALGLVTQALLVAIRLLALFAFVLVDLRLATLLERSHVLVLRLVEKITRSVHDLVQRIFNDALRAQS